MSLRVDLMQEGEYRYQGAVSRRFAGMAVAGLVTGMLLVWAAVVVDHHKAVRRELRNLEAEWSTIEGHYKRAQQKRADYAWSLGLQKELAPWVSNRVDWASRLDELNGLVARNIQLTRLNLRSEWSLIKPPPPPPPADAAETPPPPPPGQPAQRFTLGIAGRAAGEAGSDAAVALVRQLKDSPGYAAVFENIRLQNLLREERTDDLADRSFSIDGAGLSRKLE